MFKLTIFSRKDFWRLLLLINDNGHFVLLALEEDVGHLISNHGIILFDERNTQELN